MNDAYQLVVVGAGPGGYAAALRASVLGMKTLLVEKDTPGGTCLNRGCIPTKTFHYSAYLYSKLKEASKYGLTVADPGVDFSLVQQRKQQVVSEQVKGLQGLLKNEGVEVVLGRAHFVPNGKLEIERNDDGETQTVTAEKFIIATGSEEVVPQIPGINLPGIMTSREALELTSLPSSMAVIGGGVIAVEMASIFAEFGVEVTIIQRSELLRREDREMIKRLSTFLRRRGINIITGSVLKEIKESESGYTLGVKEKDTEKEYTAEKILVAVGRKPSCKGLNPEVVKLEYDEEGIKVDENMETSQPGIYAVGDVTSSGYFTAHTAFHQGIVAAENAAGKKSSFNDKVIPVCIFSQPQLARAGMTEEQARERGYRVKTGKFPFSANGKAFLQEEGDGIVKIVGDEDTGTTLGVHILGPQASELIQEGSLAVASGTRISELADLIHPHPTLSEAVWEAAMSFSKTSLHVKGR